MPLTKKDQKILRSMKKTYGSKKKAERVFYASLNAGKFGEVAKARHNRRGRARK